MMTMMNMKIMTMRRKRRTTDDESIDDDQMKKKKALNLTNQPLLGGVTFTANQLLTVTTQTTMHFSETDL